MIYSNMWSILPPRLGDGRNQVHKSREHMMYLILTGINMTGTMIATILLMDGERTLTYLLDVPIQPEFWTCLPVSSAGHEFLLLGAAPALICHLLSCLLLIAYYRCAHTWRQMGGERDFDCCCCCPSLGRLCSQEDPVIGEIPVWEQVGVFMGVGC